MRIFPDSDTSSHTGTSVMAKTLFTAKAFRRMTSKNLPDHENWPGKYPPGGMTGEGARVPGLLRDATVRSGQLRTATWCGAAPGKRRAVGPRAGAGRSARYLDYLLYEPKSYSSSGTASPEPWPKA